MPSLSTPVPNPPRRFPWLLVLAAGVLLAGGGAAAWSTRWPPPPPSLTGAGAPSTAQVHAAQQEVDEHPQDPFARLRLARLRVDRSEPDLAVPLLLTAAQDPRTAVPASVALGDCGRRFGRQEAVLPGLQKAVAAAPREPRTWAELVRMLDALGQSDPAAAALEEALRRFPDSPRLLLVHAALLAQTGSGMEAARLYERALRREPDADAQLEYAVLLARLNSARRAKAAFLKARDLNPGSVLAYLGLAKVDMELGLAAEAEREAYAGLQVAPEDPEALFILARALMEGGPEKALTARELLERVVQQRPEHLEAHYHLGVLKLRAKDARGAVREFQTVLETQPYRLDARQNYAKALQQAGDRKAAAQQQAAAAEMAQLDLTRSELTNRVSTSPRDPKLRCQLAEFYLEHNAAVQAAREFQRALELDPKNRAAAEGLERARKAAAP